MNDEILALIFWLTCIGALLSPYFIAGHITTDPRCPFCENYPEKWDIFSRNEGYTWRLSDDRRTLFCQCGMCGWEYSTPILERAFLDNPEHYLKKHP